MKKSRTGSFGTSSKRRIDPSYSRPLTSCLLDERLKGADSRVSYHRKFEGCRGAELPPELKKHVTYVLASRDMNDESRESGKLQCGK